ncbi:uncharacterized protein LOC142398735 [Odontesthes bonariensis]|uniref:uncharacterized protein LOC142398735 n=1 Tax=Odontesthes bonariensis TaxID=219752 RepID=UPI003F58F9D2
MVPAGEPEEGETEIGDVTQQGEIEIQIQTTKHTAAWAELSVSSSGLICGPTAGADGSSEELSESTWPCSDLTARPCLASAASERHFSPGSPEETPLHKMLFLPAAALCCLCSALVAMAAELSQDQLTLTRRVGQSVSFSCGTDQCSNTYVFWYQKKETETFRVILDISRSGGNIDSSYNHPQKDDFSAVNKQNGWELQIQKVKLDHSATYYCSCWKDDPGGYGYDIFGSGTKLFVTDEQVVKPVVSVCPIASRVHLEGRSSLLCLASGMFPPLVRFSWKRQKKNGGLEELPPAEGWQTNFQRSGRSAAIRAVDSDSLHTYKYSCSVEHEGVRVEVQTQQGNQGSVTVFSRDSASCGDAVKESRGAEDGHFSLQLQTFSLSEVPATPPPTAAAPPPTAAAPPPTAAAPPPTAAAPAHLPEETSPASDPAASSVPPQPVKLSASFQSELRVKLLCLLYTLLIVKSLVCCCGLSLLMILRNKGASTGCTHAD